MKKFGLIVVSAPSGAGKSTLCEKLLSDLKDRVQLSISTTSRLPRGKEVDGVQYHFVTKEKFKEKIAQGDFVEWAEVHGNYYGTSKTVIQQAMQKGRHVLLDIDVQGAASLKRIFKEECVLIFIEPPSMQALEERLRSRGTDSEDVIKRRMINAESEMQQKDRFDSIIMNDDFARAYSELKGRVLTFMDKIENG